MLYANSYHCFILISERSALNHDHERYSYSLLSPGTLTAHESFCLVLLYSYPDTVHRFPLRKTQASTPLIRGSPTINGPRQNITPTIADCWYRAPLTPQLLGALSIPCFCEKVKVVLYYKHGYCFLFSRSSRKKSDIIFAHSSPKTSVVSST